MSSNFEQFDAFAHMGDVTERSLGSEEQKRLIRKLQDETITSDEKDVLMGSLYNLVIGVARSFHPRFPDRSLEDLIEDGLLNLWLRLPGYKEDRSFPSTYSQIVVQTAYCKELKKMQRRTLRRTVTDYDGTEKEVNIPTMSLNNFMNSEGEEYEPDVLGVQDDMREQYESVMDYHAMVTDMYREVCRSVKEYKILNHILNTKILPNFGGGRRRKCLKQVAENVGTKMSHVEKVARRVRPWLEKHDFLDILTSHQIETPMADEVFKKEELAEYFAENQDEDMLSLLCGLHDEDIDVVNS